MVPAFYPKYAIFGSHLCSRVKSDPVDLTASKKRSWSQNLKSLAQKTKIWPHHLATWTQGGHDILWYFNLEIIFSDIADGLVGVGLITQDQDNPGHLTLDKGYNDMSKFLNRILGMQVNLQNLLFKYFTDTLNKIIDNVSVFFYNFNFYYYYS